MPSKKVLIVGGANIDETFTVPHISLPGESIIAQSYSRAVGGKGLNQAVALARAGTAVDFAGQVGFEGQPLKDALESAGVGIQHLKKIDSHSLLSWHLSPNQSLPGRAIALFVEALTKAKAQGITTMFNPSPIIGHQEFPWHLVDYLIINRGELDRTLESISPAVLDRSSALEARMDALLAHYPNMVIMVTLGPDGVALLSKDYRLRLPAGVLSSDVKDTTGAGDACLGYFASLISRTLSSSSPTKIGKEVMQDILAISQQAATMSVQQYSADSAPKLADVRSAMRADFVWPNWI